jgi:hypothetical protein
MEGAPAKRYERQACVVVLERQDESLDYSNATVSANCPESRTDFLVFAPIFESIVPKLRAFVADYVFRTPTSPGDALSEEMTHL